MKIRYTMCVLLNVFGSLTVCMEEPVVIPKQACEIFAYYKNPKTYCHNLTTEKKWYGLMCAIWYEDVTAVKELLKNGALDGESVEFERERMEKLSKGITHYHSNYQNTFCCIDTLPLTVAKYKKNQAIIFELEKIKYPAPLENEMCPLYALAVYLGDVKLLNDCIAQNNFDPDYYNERGGSLVAMAVRGGHDDVVELLLQEDRIKKNINESPKIDVAPVLWIAAKNGHYSIAQRLVKVPKIDVIARYYNRGPAICAAAESKHTKIVELLCEQEGTNVNAVDTYGNSALHYAAKYKDIPMIKALLHRKANTQIKGEKGKIALDIAMDHIPKIPQDIQEMMDLLKKAEAEKNNASRSVLVWAGQ